MSLDAYVRFWATLRPETTGALRELAVPELLFRDPFNEIRGVDRVVAMLDHMFATIGQPRFVVRHAVSVGATGFVRWDFDCRLRGRALAIEGMSEIGLDRSGLVTSHVDHWDAARQVYERLPLLGGLLRQVRKRLAAPV